MQFLHQVGAAELDELRGDHVCGLEAKGLVEGGQGRVGPKEARQRL
jgi:hypothetical protein